MRKLVLSISIILVIGLITIYNTISLATTGTEDGFLSVEDSNIQIGNDLLLNISIDKVDYTNFKIDITSSVQMDEVSMTEDNVDGTEATVNENNELTLIGDKTLMNVNQVTLKYSLPDNIAVGAKITINAKLTNVDDENSEVINKKIEVTVVEKQNNQDNTVTNSNIINNDNSIKAENNMQQGNTSDMTKSNNSSMSSSVNSSKTAVNSSTSVSKVETVVYNGSINNYLSSLSISGYDFNTDFTKDNSTYFIKADNISSVSVTAAAEDSTSTVKIYGQDDLKEGTNKVLVSVTAENGNVRTYRIYVIVKN